MAVQPNTMRETIIQNAVAMFKEHGFDIVTIADICAKCEINKTTFYYYFDSKDTLLHDYYTMKHDLAPTVFSAFMAEENPVERLWILLMSRLDFIIDSGWQIMKQVFVLNLTKDIQSFKINEQTAEMFTATKSVLIKAQEEGYIRNQSNPQILLVMQIQMMYGLTYAWCAKQGRFDLKKTVRVYFETMLDVSNEHRRGEEIHPFVIWNDWVCKKDNDT